MSEQRFPDQANCVVKLGALSVLSSTLFLPRARYGHCSPWLLQTPIVPPSSWPLMLQNKMHSVCERREKAKSFSITQLVEQLRHSWLQSTGVPAPLCKLGPPARPLAQLQSEPKEGMTSS